MSDRDEILDIVCRGKHRRNGPACEITCGIQVNRILRIIDAAKRGARLDEAKWWIRHLEENGDEVLDSDCARIAELERSA